MRALLSIIDAYLEELSSRDLLRVSAIHYGRHTKYISVLYLSIMRSLTKSTA